MERSQGGLRVSRDIPRYPSIHPNKLGNRGLRFAIGIALAYSASFAHAANPATPQPTRGQLLTRAHSQRDGGHRMEALALCENLLQHWPGDRDALRLRIQLLSELGAAAQALQRARELNPPLAPEEMARLQSDLAAHQTRWSQAVSADQRRPYDEADRAVALEDDALQHYSGLSRETAARLDTDRIIAYARDSQGAKAVVAYRAALKRGATPPTYAESAVADALLQQRQPEAAIPLFEDNIRHHAEHYEQDETDPRIHLAYAYLEAGRYRDAVALIDRTAASEPVWLFPPASTQALSNVHKTEADATAAQIREEAWLYREAWQRLSDLRAQAPLDATLWRELASVERARGWPRRSEDTLVSAAAIDPNDSSTTLGAIADWRELNDFARVEPALRNVEAVVPRDPEVQVARQAWDRQRGWQWDIESNHGRGNSPNYGDADHETEATLQSPLLDDHWRAYGITRLAEASLQEGSEQRNRIGLGVRGYARGLEIYAQALTGVGNRTRGNTFETGVHWFPSDSWTFGLDWSNTGDVDVPLRASYHGVTAKALNASAEWRPSELALIKASANRDQFNDGNLRRGWQVQWQQRLHTAPWFILDGGLEAGDTRNSRTDVPYYSPACAHWVMATGQLENALYQRYERAWNQRIEIAAGSYDECRYGSGWAASISYGQTYTPHAGLKFGWSLGWSSQPYDGRRDSRVALDLTMHWGE